jgi:hypothetical protein
MDGGFEEAKGISDMNKYNGPKSFYEYRQKLIKKKQQDKAKIKKIDSKTDLSIYGNNQARSQSHNRQTVRPKLKKAQTSNVVALNNPRRQPMKKKLSGVTPKNAPKTAIRKQDANEEFKRPFEKLTSNDRETEITKERELRRKLDQKLLEIETKSKLRQEMFEREKDLFHEKRKDLITNRFNNSVPEDQFENNNDRSRRKKWNKNGNTTDISIAGHEV